MKTNQLDQFYGPFLLNAWVPRCLPVAGRKKRKNNIMNHSNYCQSYVLIYLTGVHFTLIKTSAHHIFCDSSFTIFGLLTIRIGVNRYLNLSQDRRNRPCFSNSTPTCDDSNFPRVIDIWREREREREEKYLTQLLF